MQAISLIPSKPYNKSIYKADQKNCNGGLIILEDRIVEYYMDVQDTTAVSIDTSLLHQTPNSAIQFTLIVYSTGSNVLNLAGFNVEQIQVSDGKSVFSIMKGVADSVWNIQMTSSDTRPEQWLRADIYSYNPIYTMGLYSIYNMYATQGNPPGGIFSNFAPGQTATSSFGAYNYNSDQYIICKYAVPVWFKSIWIGMTTNTATALNTLPTSVQVYGTNDGVNWTQILNTELTVEYGSLNMYSCTTTNYYSMFKFKFEFTGQSTCNFPSVAVTGFVSNLLSTASFCSAFPWLNVNEGGVVPINGYNIEDNSSQQSSKSGNICYILNDIYDWYGSAQAYTVWRSGDTPWEFIFSFPDAIRTVGILYRSHNANNRCFQLFGLSYSDDKETWTEYCKVDGVYNGWNACLNARQVGIYFCDSKSKHKYYKLTIYSIWNNANELQLNMLQFLKYQEGMYYNFESFIPKLSSNTQAGYILISSDSSEGDAYKLFDQSNGSYGGGKIIDGEWNVFIQLPEATIVRGLQLTAPNSDWNRMPISFSLLGSTDNETWVNIKQFFLGNNYWGSAQQSKTWDVENETAYKYYKLVVIQTQQATYVRIGELGLCTYPSFKRISWFEDECLVPIMNSNSQDGYEASASSEFPSHSAYMAFDRVEGDGNKWITNTGVALIGSWLKIKLPTAKVANLFSIRDCGESRYMARMPTGFIIQGSNDDSSWTDLEVVSSTSWTLNETKTWLIENETAYQFYRLLITSCSGDVAGVSEFGIYIRRYIQEY